MLHMKFGFDQNLALIGNAVSEKMFEYYGHIHVIYMYIASGTDKTLGTKCFHKHKSSVHLHTHSKSPPPFNYILLISPIQAGSVAESLRALIVHNRT